MLPIMVGMLFSIERIKRRECKEDLQQVEGKVKIRGFQCDVSLVSATGA